MDYTEEVVAYLPIGCKQLLINLFDTCQTNWKSDQWHRRYQSILSTIVKNSIEMSPNLQMNLLKGMEITWVYKTKEQHEQFEYLLNPLGMARWYPYSDIRSNSVTLVVKFIVPKTKLVIRKRKN